MSQNKSNDMKRKGKERNGKERKEFKVLKQDMFFLSKESGLSVTHWNTMEGVV